MFGWIKRLFGSEDEFNQALEEACRQWCDFIEEAPERMTGEGFAKFFKEIAEDRKEELIMRKAVLFDTFAYRCPYFNTLPNSGYGCSHPEQEECANDEEGKEVGCCFCYSCPLGIEAEQDDLNNKNVDWDGLCDNGEVTESEYLLVDIGVDATPDQKQALSSYEKYMHRYDKFYRRADNG